jgi:hypothetical protein
VTTKVSENARMTSGHMLSGVHTGRSLEEIVAACPTAEIVHSP